MDYDLRVCTRSIGTLNRDGVSAKLVIECRANITAMQEMRWIGQGYKSKAQLPYGKTRIRRSLRHIVSGFTTVNERLAKNRITAKFHNISLICALAPTEEKDDAVKDAFYAKT